MLNYHHLRYFWAVATEGNLANAAEKLGVSIQTVSGQISKLEADLGRTLFQLEGRRLVLTEAGRVARRYADEIFRLGEQMLDTLADEALERTLRLNIGVSDVLPKTASYRLLAPVLHGSLPVKIECIEGRFEELLPSLLLHKLDLVLSDRPYAQGGPQQIRSHLLGKSPVSIFGSATLISQLTGSFPECLQGKPMLLPTHGSVLRAQIDDWLTRHRIQVNVLAEFDDGALMKTFGMHGEGFFPAPCFDPEDITTQFQVIHLGRVDDVFESYYALVDRPKLNNPAVQLLLAGVETRTRILS
ncbi:transcriptional activator NhaR [Zwartia sp.]|uniref:transcriptional activator NhaR n=1 Tax=Zwartia sp. TaxID=2978004 RepID=UPI00271744F1|nr:transcriptional activator NhaR [Zwartia sp.]MDO9025998.1 transcriptional activator NhaR [Zwartia sp.]